jgi:hypothetical protein
VEPIFGDYLLEENGVARHAYGAVAQDLLQLASHHRPNSRAGSSTVKA